MKILKSLLLAVAAFLLIGAIASYFYMQSFHPQYEGSIKLSQLEKEVEVYFDEYGVPHIYAQSEEDAYLALGYVHAQDRLYQMEMMRRVGNGTLSEILGEELVKTDRLFRTIGIKESAKKGAAIFQKIADKSPMKKAALAYLTGINTYIKQGKLPIEYSILGFSARPFTIEDCYAIYGYMAFSFAQAFRTDPLLVRIHQKYGPNYLQDLDVHWHPDAQKIPVFKSPSPTKEVLSDAFDIDDLFESLPVAPWIGSNSWVIGPSKTKNGKVLFSNDTHIKFAQPSVWYEAHLEYPEGSHYGNYLAAVPFPPLGHNRHHAIGLTMLENDDIDFYIEKPNPDNPNQVWFVDKWEDMDIRQETIKVKGAEDVVFEVKTTRHGPIVNEALEDLARTTEQPLAMWWTYHKFDLQNLQASYRMLQAQSMEEVEDAIALGHAPGLNVMYGDVEGNIAWWTMGKLHRRPAHVNSKLFLDGASGKDEPIAWLDFKDNPSAVNPPSGFVYSANNQPDTSGGMLLPGYYIPEDRAQRIVDILNSDKKWDLEGAKEMINDVQSPIAPEIAKEIVAIAEQLPDLNEQEKKALALLKNWDGSHQVSDIVPTIYTKLMVLWVSKTFKDELGEEDYEAFLQTHLIKRTLPLLIKKEHSRWWDNVQTENIQESRTDIIQASFRQAIADLEQQLGKDMQQWQWEKVHTIEHPHPLGQVAALRPLLNVGPLAVKGSIETLNNMMFHYTENGLYEVYAGPAKRRIVDFGDVDHSISVLPTGQSGNPMSKHYNDQAELFVKGEFRVQQMNKEEIVKKGKLLKMNY